MCVQRRKSFNIWAKSLLQFTRTHSLLRDIILFILGGEMDKKKKGPQKGISDQKLLAEHCCISIVDEQQICQHLTWLAQWSSDHQRCHEEALSTGKSSDTHTIRGLCLGSLCEDSKPKSILRDYQPLSRCLKEHVYIS